MNSKSTNIEEETDKSFEYVIDNHARFKQEDSVVEYSGDSSLEVHEGLREQPRTTRESSESVVVSLITRSHKRLHSSEHPRTEGGT